MKAGFLYLLLGISVNAHGQDSIPVRIGSHLRLHMKLADTLVTSIDPDEPWLCKFTHLQNYGEPYDPPVIYVYVTRSQLYRWNPEHIIGNSYWLVVCQTDDCYDGLPVYRHCGNF